VLGISNTQVKNKKQNHGSRLRKATARAVAAGCNHGTGFIYACNGWAFNSSLACLLPCPLWRWATFRYIEMPSRLATSNCGHLSPHAAFFQSFAKQQPQ